MYIVYLYNNWSAFERYVVYAICSEVILSNGGKTENGILVTISKGMR